MNGILRQAKIFADRNASTILTCLGGAGVVATAILAVKATPKAIMLLDQAEEDKGEKLTKLETVQVAGPVYIPSIVTGLGTLACIFGSNVLNKRQQASLVSAYTLLNNSYKGYRSKVEELYGEKTDDRVKSAIAKDRYTDANTDDDKRLFYDDFSGRYFESTMEDVVKAEYLANRSLALSGCINLNEFYETLDIDPIDCGDRLGWSSYELIETTGHAWIDFRHDICKMDDGLECFIITFWTEPSAEYMVY